MRAFGDRLIARVFALVCALVCALGVLAALPTGARAGPYEDALGRFANDSFDETIEGINAVGSDPIGGSMPQPANPWLAARPRTSRRCASTTACAASSKPRSAA